jgi:predicted GIY-YIG superfamily endonuclease
VTGSLAARAYFTTSKRTLLPAKAYPMPRKHHHVYVVELSKDVLLEPRFRKGNPGYVDGKPCVYVGMTGLDPDVRFDKHKAGIQANRFVQQYGMRLLPDLYEGFNPMGYDDAVDKEIEVGIDLRSAGFGVWQA